MTAAREVRPLTGLRGVAAISVALGHYGVGGLSPLFGVLLWKNAAVDLFFCLSGFTLCLAYQAGQSRQLPLRDYFVARVGRIYPLYLLTMAISLLIASHNPSFGPFYSDADRHVAIGNLIRQLTMTNAWAFIGSGIHWNFPAWSISVEFFCYLFVFPAIFYLSGALGRVGWAVRAILAVAAMALSSVVFLRYYDQRIMLMGRTAETGFPEISYAVNLIRGVLGFLAGWLVYRSYLDRDRLWRLTSRWVDLFSLAGIVFLVCGALHLISNQYILVVFPFLILGLTVDQSVSGRFLSWGPIHYLGKISYSIYILHIPWLVLTHFRLKILVGAQSGNVTDFLLLLAGLMVISVASYHLLEMPLRRLVRGLFSTKPSDGYRLLGSRHAAQAVSVAAVLLLIVAQAGYAGVLRPVRHPSVAVGQEILSQPLFRIVSRNGWSFLEDWGVWTDGPEATLELPLAAPPAPALKLSVKGIFFVAPGHESVSATIRANGVAIGVLRGSLEKPEADAVLDLPHAVFAVSPQGLTVSIAVDRPASPHDVGSSEDTRQLGLGLKSMMLVDGAGLP